MLQSNRLIYTLYNKSDFEDYKRLCMDYQVMKYITGKVLTDEEVNERFGRIISAGSMHDGMGCLSVKLKENNKAIGLAKFVFYGAEKGSEQGFLDKQAEVGYSFFPEHWGNGYATELTQFFTEHAKTIDGIDEVLAIIDPDNAASKRILTKCGYTLYSTENFNRTLPAEWYKIKLK
jgi:ribosomal-protein-alanine N-acetyltransferase